MQATQRGRENQSDKEMMKAAKRTESRETWKSQKAVQRRIQDVGQLVAGPRTRNSQYAGNCRKWLIDRWHQYHELDVHGLTEEEIDQVHRELRIVEMVSMLLNQDEREKDD